MDDKNHTDPVEAIESHLRKIQEQMATLEKEAAELRTALDVLQRLSPDAKSTRSVAAGAPRPEGIPTTFEMIEFVLRDAEEHGSSGLTAREIVDAIDRRYWPGVADKQIQPSLYRFAKIKRLKKRGNKFQRIPKDDPSPEEAGSAEGANDDGDGSKFWATEVAASVAR